MPGDSDKEVSDEITKNVLTNNKVVRKLQGNGDFRSRECINYLKECDICCTNAPFSLFASLFSLIVKYNKNIY